MSATLTKRKYQEVVTTGRQLRARLLEAFALVQRPKNQEFRGVWDHSGMGLYPGNWAKTARILSDTGMRAVFVNVLWAGLAHYDSQVVPQSDAVRRYGDQLKQCLAAAHANRLEVHVWKVCWNLGNAPEAFVASMRKAGRLQVTDTGKELEWLCPSHPDNVALELKAVGEVLDLVGELAASGCTIVMATHEMGFARQVADRVCFLDGGTIIESGSAEQVLTDPKHERTQQFLRRVTGAGRD